MRVPNFILHRLERLPWRLGQTRPHHVIGAAGDVYLNRWYVTPWRGYRGGPRWWQRALVRLCKFLPAVYLHQFCRSDDDRALHDHPWASCSIILLGAYDEHTIDAGGIHRRTRRRPGSIAVRRAKSAHRVELVTRSCWTVFITGFRLRQWGFHCPHSGWVHWRDFTDQTTDGNTVGKGCDQ